MRNDRNASRFSRAARRIAPRAFASLAQERAPPVDHVVVAVARSPANRVHREGEKCALTNARAEEKMRASCRGCSAPGRANEPSRYETRMSTRGKRVSARLVCLSAGSWVPAALAHPPCYIAVRREPAFSRIWRIKISAAGDAPIISTRRAPPR